MNEITEGNVARYCKPSSLDEDGYPASSAFQRRPNRNERYLSAYLLEFFKNDSEKENVAEVRKEIKKHFNLKKNGLYAILNIEQSKADIMKEIKKRISYKETNLPHCGIFHDYDDLVISELLAECVQSKYKVKDVE
ncbi:hypothetical protein [Desulfonema magnum]|uniref:Uncharacterized protein n=1 Tax=Desulfonema magnum TaxID=45655 RepID=A0A975BH81_9BACT|nr:hypothetical protein [Desulfonema magnum]QTA85238.1 Uncharacterized protein dnm_012430 [Desulfonema magnum]